MRMLRALLDAATSRDPRARRLRAIARMLEFDVSDAEFDMDTWRSRCGTAGCVIGHAVERNLIPGLEMRQITAADPFFPYHPESGKGDTPAVAVALEIDYDIAQDLFMPFHTGDRDVSRLAVATRIREFAGTLS